MTLSDFQKDIDLISSIGAVPTILDVVCQTTGMGFAAVARVTEERWIACNVRDDIAFGLKPGGELKVETTICHEISRDKKAVIINHVNEDEMYRAHHTPLMYGFQSYISMPIILPNNRFFGTLCAIDPKPAKLNNPEVIGMFKLFAELIAFHVDASERLIASESKLMAERETSELREQFIAVLSHDLRNPLGAISSGASILKMTVKDERSLKVVDMMRDCVLRMTGLIENVLDFARGRLGGGITLDRNNDTSVEPVLDQIITEMQSTWPDRVIEKHFSLKNHVNCDQRRLAQLFSNLLGNAVTYGKVDQPVKVNAISNDKEFILSVSNKADPIPAETLARLFHPFSRGNSNEYKDGLGLGLYIASEIAQAHNGTLEVISNEQETKFTLKMRTA